jgi:hypothetical protein
MLSFLANHAMLNVWCLPRQDTQAILKPTRVTDRYGVFNGFDLCFERYELPELKKRFNVYQVGQLNPELLGLFDTKDRWVSLTEVMCKKNMIFEVYTAKGVMIPRFSCYYRFTKDRNLIIAVRENKAIPWDIVDEPIYFRVYSGSYFRVLRENLEPDKIVHTGVVFETKKDRTAMTEFYRKYVNKPGFLYIWVNGWLRDTFDVALFKENDVVEMLYDSTIYKKLSLKLTDLPTFDSILDRKTKYLISYSGNENDLSVDYFDDMDFYIKRNITGNISENKGCYFHRNNVDAVRQLTHRDYSICVPYVVNIINNNNFFHNEDDIYIDILIRKSGIDRKLINVENRIHELYKLPYLYRLNAMLGIRSNVDIWRADTLENSKYMHIMGSEELTLDVDYIADAYGYNSIALLTGNTPIIANDFITSDAVNRIKLPYNLQQLGACYEYDANGRLLEVHNNRSGCHYPIRNYLKTKLVEVISGYGSESLDDEYDPNEKPVYSYLEYRVYRCKKGEESIPSKWEDITNKDLHYVIKDGVFTWLTDQSEYTTLVRSDKNILDYDLLIKNTDGYFSFNIVQKVLFKNSVKYVKMFVPLGHLDIYLNGYSLVEGVDYVVDFPKVVIISKRYLDDPLRKEQRVHVRFSSFCQSDLSLIPAKQKGYVKHNTISVNKRYDIKDNKVLRIVIAGATMDRSILGFSEDNTVIKVPNQVREGSPYCISDIIVPFRGITKEDTYKYRERAEQIDKSVEDYLSQFIKDKEYNQPEHIKELYPLYSPFISTILNDMLYGSFNFPKLTDNYNDNDVSNYVKKYEWLLKYDPVKSQLTFVDYEYCIVHPVPHYEVITVNLYQYKFLEAVVRLYMESKIKLSHFLKIGEYNGDGH